jgi:hypothetical protein
MPCASFTNVDAKPRLAKPATRWRTSSLGDAPRTVMFWPLNAAATSKRLASLLLPGNDSVA